MNSFIGTKEAAEKLGISVRRVQALITAGKLPAEKIGNSFAICEGNLKLLKGRKNGRPKPAYERSPEEWKIIVEKMFGKESKKALKNKKNRETSTGRKPKIKATHRTQNEWEAIIDKFSGCVSLGPPDISTNKKYLEGLGRDKVFRR